ncbi:MAG: polyisoprenoid-binding protein, partial [Candidatus Omnitrophica bacterium CG12_big_fil_rev_8_21_14_0_65_50_5]
GTVIAGDLTIKNVTKRINIPAEISGPVQGPQGGSIIGISGATTINRQDFGVSFNKVLETGGLVVSDDVKIIVELEAHGK